VRSSPEGLTKPAELVCSLRGTVHRLDATGEHRDAAVIAVRADE
jgi:hypothetical protein